LSLAYLPAIAAERLEKRRQTNTVLKPPTHWGDWSTTLFPTTYRAGFADRHAELWDWADSIRLGVKPDPSAFVAIWGRGGAKSTTVEGVTVRLGAEERRKFALYIRGTQDKSNESIGNIAALMEANSTERYYPKMASRQVGKYGNSKGWRVDMLRCGNGFNVVGLGLDAAIRGVKIEEFRPDLIIFDDIDDKNDTDAAIKKKESIITHSILPAGSTDCAVLFVQNLIHARSIASRLADTGATGADYLRNRHVSGPHKAVDGLVYETVADEHGAIRHVITGGVPTWAGQDLAVCQSQIDDWGLLAFLAEAQNDIKKDSTLALWNRELLDTTRRFDVPDLFRIAVAVDPHSTSGQTGIIVIGVARLGNVLHGFVLDDVTPERAVKPEIWGGAAVAAYHKWQADVIVGEINHGGDMIENVIRNVEGGRNVAYKTVRATRGKYTRAEPVSAIFSDGRGHLAGYFPELENELCQWEPGDESPNRLDSMVWGFTELMLDGRKTARARSRV
jgi:Terminase RNaseH-like domain